MDLTTIKDRIVSEISSIIDQGAKILKIETAAQYEAVNKLIASAYNKSKELEAERKVKVKPLIDEWMATHYQRAPTI